MYLPLTIRHHGRELQPQILGVHLGLDVVADPLGGPRRDLHIVARGRQVAEDLLTLPRERDAPEGTPDKDDGDRVGLLVCEGDDGLGGLAVDELYAEDLGGGEGGAGLDGESGLRGRSVELFIGLGRWEWLAGCI